MDWTSLSLVKPFFIKDTLVRVEEDLQEEAWQVLVSADRQQISRQAAGRLLRWLLRSARSKAVLPVHFFNTVLAANQHGFFKEALELTFQLLRKDSLNRRSSHAAAVWKRRTLIEGSSLGQSGSYKWVGFYQGSYAPHLPADAPLCDPAGQLPWRSHQPASQLRDFLATEDVKGRALELGCGTGENLVALAGHGFDFVCGVDVVKEAVEISIAAMQMQPSSNWQVICADILELPTADIALLDGGSWQFDFIFDCQYQVDQEATARAIAHLLAPGGELLMLTGNSEEPMIRVGGLPPQVATI
eukprot:s2336_g3.t1